MTTDDRGRLGAWLTTDVPAGGRRGRRLSSLRAAAGRPGGWRSGGGGSLEDRALLDSLEARVLLAGDHPSFSDFPTATDFTGSLSGGGEAAIAGVIGSSTDDDLFSFTVPSDGNAGTTEQFITALADVENEASSTLDSRIEVYDAAGTLIASGSTTTPDGAGPITDPTPVTDGWAGFVGTEGDQYFIRVLGENTTSGSYTLRVDALPTVFGVPSATNVTQLGIVQQPLDDQVFRVTTGSSAIFDSVFTAHAVTQNPALLDPRLEVFDAEGNLVRAASEGSTGSNAFTAFKGEPNSTYYFRVRGDEQSAGEASQGGFTLVLDAAARAVTVDPVSRVGETTITLPGGPPQVVFTELLSFVAQRTGRSVLDVIQGPATPIVLDPAMSLYDSTGTLIAFNEDSAAGTERAQLTLQLTGGETYFVLVDAFRGGGEAAQFFVETGLVEQAAPDPLDDHGDVPDPEVATPLVWGDPLQAQRRDANALGGFSFFPIQRPHEVQVASGTGRLDSATDTDIFVFTPPIDMLGQFEGVAEDLPGPDGMLGTADDVSDWRLNQRPSTRLQIVVEPFFDDADIGSPGAPGAAVPGFTEGGMTPQVRLLDSRGRVVAASGGGTAFSSGNAGGALGVTGASSVLLGNPTEFFPDPAGGFVEGYQVWGGQAYYLEISNLGQNPGRYNFSVQTDAFPDPSDASSRPATPVSVPSNEYVDGNFPNISSWFTESPNEGQFAFAEQSYELDIDSVTGDGGFTPNFDGRYADVIGGALPGTGTEYERAFTANSGVRFATGADFNAAAAMMPDFNGDLVFAPNQFDLAIFQEGGLQGIQHPLDTDMFFFRAPASGPIEVRINTTGLQDRFVERLLINENGMSVNESITDINSDINDSLLDSQVRIFNSDRVEIAFNDDSGVVDGRSAVQQVGTESRTFQRRDGRVVFDAVAGNTYFIQIESGQREEYLANQTNPTQPVSWANLIGSYELLVNALPSSPADVTPDDHVDFDGAPSFAEGQLATPIGLSELGAGSVTGLISDFSNAPVDSDGFTFLANATGPVTITMARTTGDLTSRITLFDQNFGQIGMPATANLAGVATLTFSAVQGQRYFIEATAAGGLGNYTIALDGESAVDDHADLSDPALATAIALNDFLGTGSATGDLETAGDVDVFTVEALDFQRLTVSVTPTGGSALNPRVEVYELQLDLQQLRSGDPAYARLALLAVNGDAIGGGGVASSVDVDVTPTRRSVVTGLNYPTYYIVVRGEDSEADRGEYDLSISFDPTDDHPDNGEFELAGASTINISETTGLGADTGELERDGDTDLFRFVTPASGRVRVDIDADLGSSLRPQVRLFDASMTEIPASSLGGLVDTGTGTASATLAFAPRDEAIFVLVDTSTAAGSAAQRTGTYSVTIETPPVDDHANISEFDLATNLILSPATGDGGIGVTTGDTGSNPMLDPNFDTDLFSFTPVEEGAIEIVVTPTGSGTLIRPEVRVFDASQTEIASSTGSANGSVVTISLSDRMEEAHFILVSEAGQSATGGYAIEIDGPEPTGSGGPGGGGGGGDDTDEVDFNNPTTVPLESADADGDINGAIDVAGDRDLFTFVAPADGRIFVQVVTPSGSLLDASLTVLDQPNESESSLILFDAGGVPGATANGSFDGMEGTTYYLIVDGLGAGVGAYTVRIDAAPETFFLYYPEGFASPTVNEFVSIANANTFDVDYTVILRYETGERDQVVQTGTIPAGERGGVTLNRGTLGSPVGVRQNEPYSIEIQADGPLGATLAHYDFGATLGDAFVDEPSESWVFPRLERTAGAAFDFVLFYNPNPFAVEVTLTGFDANGNEVSVPRTVEAFRRGGYSLASQTTLPTGIFSGVLEARPADDANADAFRGVVASLSHYDVALSSGFAALGDDSGGATAGALTSVENGTDVTSQLVLFNPSSSTATLRLEGSYLRVDLPDLLRVVELAPQETLVLTGPSIGLAPNQPAGITYTSSAPISVLGVESQFGDANSVDAATEASQIAFFGDAFINTAFAGELYFETLNFYNPASQPLSVDVELLFFNDPVPATITVNLEAGGFGELVLHELDEILDRNGLVAFSIQVSAARPFVVSLEHYDLFLLGGWQAPGAAIGLTNSIADILA